MMDIPDDIADSHRFLSKELQHTAEVEVILPPGGGFIHPNVPLHSTSDTLQCQPCVGREQKREPSPFARD